MCAILKSHNLNINSTVDMCAQKRTNRHGETRRVGHAGFTVHFKVLEKVRICKHAAVYP